MAPGGAPGPPVGAPGPARDLFILPGFAPRLQLELDVRSASFRAIWVRRTYTDDSVRDRVRDCISAGGGGAGGGDGQRSPETLFQEVCYGNNVTLLFRLCFHLSDFYGSATLWESMARGFSTTPGAIEDMVKILSRARSAYIEQHGPALRSGATKAADLWIDYVETRGAAPRPHRGGSAAFHRVESYLANAAGTFLQMDSAAILDRPRSRPPASTWRPSRKRSRSPQGSWDGDQPGPKRTSVHVPTPSPGPSHRREPSSGGSAAAALDAVAASSVNSEVEAARQAGQTPGKAEDVSKAQRVPPSSDGGRAPSVENTYRIRSCASQDKTPTPSPGELLAGGEEDVVARLRQRIEQLEKENAALQRAEIQEKAAASTDPLQKLASFEKRLAETETQRTRDAENAQAMIASLETKLSTIAAYTETLQGLQAKLGSLENRLVLLQTAPPVEVPSRSTVTKPYAGEDDLRGLEARVAALEHEGRPSDPPGEGETSVGAEPAIARVEHRLAMLEGTLYASTAMNTPSTRDIMDRLSALEAQGPRFVKTTFDAPQTPKSPSPSHDATIQRNMENMVNKKIQSLPTMASVTEKVIQIETSFREMFTPYQRDTNARLDTAEKEIDASKVRIKELNKQLNKNTNELDKWSASIKGLEGAVTKLINRPNTASGGQVAPCPNNDELASLKQAIKEEEKKREAAAAKTALLMNHVNKIDTEVGELLRHLQPDGL